MPTSIDELDGHIGIAYSRTGIVVPWNTKAADGRAQRICIRSQISMDDVQAIAAAAIDGFGLAWLPSWLLARYVKSGELISVLDYYRVSSQEIYAVWPKVRHLRCKTRVAIDTLIADIPAMISA
jgi:DNA-binding transcriptional LysR family regulator